MKALACDGVFRGLSGKIGAVGKIEIIPDGGGFFDGEIFVVWSFSVKSSFAEIVLEIFPEGGLEEGKGIVRARCGGIWSDACGGVWGGA